MKQQRVLYVDGIRGMAAMIVVFYHYLLAFYPGFFMFKPEYMHTSRYVEETISLTPFSILYNSGFAVYLFFVISGYALSYKYFITKSREYLRSSAIRRYFRLEIPILFSVLVSYILLKTGSYTNIYTAMNYTKSTWFGHLWSIDPDFLNMVKQGVLSSLFSGGTLPYNTVLWTMSVEFICSLIIFSILALFGDFPRRFLIYAILIIALSTSYLPPFIIGLALCDYYHLENRKMLPKSVVFLLFLLSIYLGSYQKMQATNIWIPLDTISSFNKSFPFTIGAALFVFVTINSNWLKRFFSSSILQFLGKISFSLYLIHLLLIGSLACFLFAFFFVTLHLSYNLSFILMFLLTLSITLGVSFAMYKYIDIPGTKLSKWVYRKFFAGNINE